VPSTTTDIDLLAGILTKTGDLIAGVAPDRRDRSTPCPDFDVAALVDHLVGWARSFDAAANGRTFEGDPSAVRAGDDAASRFRTSAAGLVAGWRAHGFDRAVSIAGGDSPARDVHSAPTAARAAFDMTLMEFFTHGWDLAVGSGQPVPFTDEEAELVLARAERTLPPQYRGEHMPFGEIVPVDAAAPALDRLIGFMGRDPAAAV
jgi:uncharacterized protein (TIGR03086 family)